MKTDSNIVFLNSYQALDWYPPERLEICRNIIEWIPQYILSNALFNRGSVTLKFLSGGVSSITCRIHTDNGQYVLRVSTSTHPRSGTDLCLRKWREAGISTPEIFDVGVIGQQPFILMEYIDALPISSTYTASECLDNNIYFQLGEILAQMHTVRAVGCGFFVGDRGEYDSVLQWYGSPRVQQDIQTAIDEKFIARGDQTLIERFIDYANGSNRMTYCHNDYSISNVLLAEHLVVIDPDPMIHHSMFDIARSITVLANTSVNIEQAAEQFIVGYSKDESLTQELYGAILLQSCFKFCYWRRSGKTSSIEKLKKFISLPLKLS